MVPLNPFWAAASEEARCTALPADAESSVSAVSFFLSNPQPLRWVTVWFREILLEAAVHGIRKKYDRIVGAEDMRLQRCTATAPEPSSVCFADTFPGGEGNPLRRGWADRGVRPYGCGGKS